MRGPVRKLRTVDLFCGAGGMSLGAHRSGEARLLLGVNHWDVAVKTHRLNFPEARHINSRVDQVLPSECPKFDLLMAGPSCTHHSNARGGRPTSDQQRSDPWDLLPWISHHRPARVIVENVRELLSWGPVGSDGRPIAAKRGVFFQKWVTAIREEGYTVDWQVLNSADYGAATARSRLFIVAFKGARAVEWPTPRRSRTGAGGLPPWRGAVEVINWQTPCPSIFARPQPLADKTLSRIEVGIRKFVAPVVVTLRKHASPKEVGEPLPTITAGGRHAGLAVPFAYQLMGRGTGRTREVERPLPTIVASRSNFGLAVPYLVQWDNHGGRGSYTYPTEQPVHTLTSKANTGVAVPYLVTVNHGGSGEEPYRARSVADPVPTLTTSKGQAVAVPLVLTYYSNGAAYPVSRPLCTISTNDRCGLATVMLQPAAKIEPRSEGERRLHDMMQELGLADIGFRMLDNPELAAAQGFHEGYRFVGNKGEVTRQIGNSVPPDLAEVLTRACA